MEYYPDDGNSKPLRKVCNKLTVSKTSYPRRQQYSSIKPEKPQITWYLRSSEEDTLYLEDIKLSE
jgi:hypothetical protein